MKFKKTVLLLFVLAMSLLGYSQETLFKNIKFNDDIETVKKQVLKISDVIKLSGVDNSTFPLAKNNEAHLVAYNIASNGAFVNKAVFTFSDGALSYIECSGNVNSLLKTRKDDKTQPYLHFQVYMKDLIFVDKKSDKLWMVTLEGAHLHLFTWQNPYLNDGKRVLSYKNSVKLPRYIKMGKRFNKLKKKLLKKSSFIQIDTLNKKNSNAQIQINSFGIPFAGFPRKFEVRFEDEKLNSIWILTAKEEEERIQQQLTNTYGNPIFTNEEWCFYKNWMVALRKDTPEVLFLSKELAKNYKEKLSKK